MLATKKFLTQVANERAAHKVETPRLPDVVEVDSLQINSSELDFDLSSNEMDSSLWGTNESGEIDDQYLISEFCRENAGATASEMQNIMFGRWTVSINERNVFNALLGGCTAKQRAEIAWEEFSLDSYTLNLNGYLELIKG